MKVTDNFPNPDYGNLIFRRAIRLTNQPGETIGELEDSMHGLRSRLFHDGKTVTAIATDFVRYPLTTCPAASTLIDGLAGLKLSTPIGAFYEGARRHCTHMHDLSWWMMSHAARDEEVRLYQCFVPDHPGDREIVARLLVNGEERLAWTIRSSIIQGPEPFAGRHLMKGGFVGWAIGAFEGEALEAVLVLHKAFFVSLSHMIRPPMGPIQPFERAFDGVCWSYSAPRADEAERLPSYREFPEGRGLLEFNR